MIVCTAYKTLLLNRTAIRVHVTFVAQDGANLPEIHLREKPLRTSIGCRTILDDDDNNDNEITDLASRERRGVREGRMGGYVCKEKKFF